jgi:hypothetical protein
VTVEAFEFLAFTSSFLGRPAIEEMQETPDLFGAG